MRRVLTRAARGLAFAALLLALWTTGCEDPTGAVTGITGVSGPPNDHFHRATIPLSDVENPPTNGRSYVSTTDAGHSHVVTLTNAQLTTLQQNNGLVNVTSSTAGDNPHSHSFTFER